LRNLPGAVPAFPINDDVTAVRMKRDRRRFLVRAPQPPQRRSARLGNGPTCDAAVGEYDRDVIFGGVSDATASLAGLRFGRASADVRRRDQSDQNARRDSFR